ncbi:MAG: hypothetical protein LQ346_005155 [Caloplaca aetnensis]|nr:MAG: hypothetical protein LQ346_005155 [Caloplaca aetnensis]
MVTTFANLIEAETTVADRTTVVRTPEDAAGRKAAFDYVLLCVKALPDVYDLAAVIESVVTPQHTCILINTTHTLGVEADLEQRFPTNVVLSLVSGAEITQLGASEFEHHGATDVWVGPANQNETIPVAIQNDMAEALAMTLSTGQVDAKVSANIRQQQYERMIGPIAFHPSSVLFEIPSHAQLIEKVGVRSLISDVIDELLQIASSQGCRFESDFKEKTIQAMIMPTETQSIMYQDFTARRPMEVETYLGSPIKLAHDGGMRIPRIETLYALLVHCNSVNQTRPVGPPASPNTSAGASGPAPPPRAPSATPRPPINGGINGPPNGYPMNGNGMRGGRNGHMGPGPMNGPPMRRGPPPTNGYPSRPSNGYNPRGIPPNQISRRPSFENNDLEEFSHLVLYDDIPEGGAPVPNHSEQALRDREFAIRQQELRLKELQLKEQELNMRRGFRPPPPRSHAGGFDDDDDDDDFFDPMAARGPPPPQIDPENFDMMSVTSRKNRKTPSLSQIRRDPEASGGRPSMRGSHSFRPGMNRNRLSSQMMAANMPGVNDNLLENPLMGYSSNRYGAVDRKMIHDDSRTNSLTAARLNELQGPGNNAGMNGAYPQPRRTSQPPGPPLQPGGRPMGRPSPPHDGYMGPGAMPNGGPSPNGMMRQPIPRHPPGQGNAVAPYQVEQHAGVSNLYPPKGPAQKQVRSLTGSASASAGSGDSAHIESEPSAHSSQSSLGPRQAAAVAAAQGRMIGVS